MKQRMVVVMDTRVPADFPLTVLRRLEAAGTPVPERHAAVVALVGILSGLETQSFACRERASDLAVRVGMDPRAFVGSMKTLANAGVVTIGAHKGTRRIFVTPDGAPSIGRPRRLPVR